jgi:hypothetical protein
MTIRAYKMDLTIRKAESPLEALLDRELESYEPHLIYRVRVGPRAFGLPDKDSDEVERGIYLPPAEWHWSLQPLPEQIEFKRVQEGKPSF